MNDKEKEFKITHHEGLYKNLPIFIEYLSKLHEKGDKNNYLIIEEDNADVVYVQYIGGPGYDITYVEAVSNEYLSPKRKLTNDKISILENIGFKVEPSSKNFFLNFDVSNENKIKELASLTLRIFDEVYDSPDDVRFNFNLQLSG